MKWLLMLLVLTGCTAPTEPKQNYYLSFLKEVDTIFVDVSQRQSTEIQTTKHIGAITNIRDKRMVLITGNIYIRATAGFGYIDTISTVNPISYTNNGYVGTVFGAFPNMVGMTATVIAKIVDDIETVEQYVNPNLRRILATDTIKVIILPRK